MEMSKVQGGGEWAGVGWAWTGGSAAFGAVAAIGGAFAAAPLLIGVAIIAGAAFGAAGAMVLILDSTAKN